VGEQYVIFDLQSTGGTTVNGRAVVKQALVPGDVISLAGVPLVYGREGLTERESTQKLPVEPDSAEQT
jgi:pSer/pThr/pTyr-binding forkhead associated (FHA) protein